MPLDWSCDIVALVQLSSVKGFNKANLIFRNSSCIEKPNVKQSRFRFSASIHGNRLSQDAIRTRRQNLDLRALLTSCCDELFAVLVIAMTLESLAIQTAGIQLCSIRGCYNSALAW